MLVDMFSEDATREIALRHGCRIFDHERTGFVEPARAFALEQALHDWVFVIDSDEILEPKLIPNLQEIARSDAADAVWIPSKNFMFGQIVHGAGFGADQDRHVRFFKRQLVKANKEIHSGLVPEPAARQLKLCSESHGSLVHFNYLDVAHFVEKLNRYTTIELTTSGDQSPKRHTKVARRLFGEFRHRFYRRGGRRDGWRGFYLSLLMVMYDVVIEAKRAEAAEGFSKDRAEQHYLQYAEELLANAPRGANVLDR